MKRITLQCSQYVRASERPAIKELETEIKQVLETTTKSTNVNKVNKQRKTNFWFLVSGHIVGTLHLLFNLLESKLGIKELAVNLIGSKETWEITVYTKSNTRDDQQM